MFFCTANIQQNIPPALKDRMEIIQLSGYTELEKEHIAREHLIPKQIEENGLTTKKIRFHKKSILKIIRNYTREAGVRKLERQIANASALADQLAEHPLIKWVRYPFRADHPQHKIALQQMSGGGGIITISLKGNQKKTYSFC